MFNYINLLKCLVCTWNSDMNDNRAKNHKMENKFVLFNEFIWKWSKMILEMIIETLHKKYVSKITLLKALNKTLFWSVYKIVNMFYIWIFIFSRKIFLYIGYSIVKELWCLYSFFSIISLFVICKLENKSFTWNFVLEVIEWRMFLLIHADTHAYTWTFSELEFHTYWEVNPTFHDVSTGQCLVFTCSVEGYRL